MDATLERQIDQAAAKLERIEALLLAGAAAVGFVRCHPGEHAREIVAEWEAAFMALYGRSEPEPADPNTIAVVCDGSCCGDAWEPCGCRCHA